MGRNREIEVLTLAQRIAAELESGRVDDVDMDDEQVDRVAAMLRPAAPPGYAPVGQGADVVRGASMTRPRRRSHIRDALLSTS